jgi:hypothetical protein
MTGNQWTQDGNLPVAGSTTTDRLDASAGSTASASKVGAAKQEAAQVAGEAAGAVQGVAQTAKDEAGHVASEVKTNAQDLLHQARTGLAGQASAQQQKVAEGVRTLSDQLHAMADAPEQQGAASDLIRQAAERSQSVASWIESREPGDLFDEVKSFARRRPGTFLLLAAGAGLVAGRLARGLAPAPAPAVQAVPPRPIQPPVTVSTVPTELDEPLYDETDLGRPASGGPVTAGPGMAGAGLAYDVLEPNVPGEGRHL